MRSKFKVPILGYDAQRLKAGGEWDDRGWDGWMASPTQWTWVLVNSERCSRTGKLGMLQSMGSQRVGLDWVTEQQQKLYVTVENKTQLLLLEII